MALNPTSMIALPVQWTAAQNAVYSSSGGPVAVTLVPLNTWTRTFLVPSAGAGTSEINPIDLLRRVQTGLNTVTPGLWTVRLNLRGRVEIVFNGASPATSTITWSTVAVARALGFSGSTCGPFSTGTVIEGDMLPAFVWYPLALDNDDGWRATFALAMGAMGTDGQETVWNEGTQLISRTMRARYAPTSETERIARGFNHTPMWPPKSEPDRWFKPALNAAACPSAWTVHETLSVAPGRRLAFALYDLPEVIAGTELRYGIGAIPLASVSNAQARAKLSVPSFVSLVDVPSFDLTLTTFESRA